MSKKPKKYTFTTHNKGFRKPKVYHKTEDELEDHELELLYGEFENHWNHLPLKLKNRFLRWLNEQAKILADKQKN